MLELAGVILVEAGEPRLDPERRIERLTGGLLRRRVQAEESQNPVADELVDIAARILHRLAHRLEIAVEDEHRVEGQALLGEAREAAQVAEQHRDLPLLPLGPAAAHQGGHAVAPGGQDRHDGDLADGPELAGEPHIGARLDARQRARAPGRVGGGWSCRPSITLHPAGGAAAAPAADRNVRDPGRAAGLQHAEPRRHGHDLIAGVADADPARPQIGAAQ